MIIKQLQYIELKKQVLQNDITCPYDRRTQLIQSEPDYPSQLTTSISYPRLLTVNYYQQTQNNQPELELTN